VLQVSETDGTLDQGKKTFRKLGSERFTTLFYDSLLETGALALFNVNIKLRRRLQRDRNLR